MVMSDEKACLLLLGLIVEHVFVTEKPLTADQLARMVRDVADLRGQPIERTGNHEPKQ